MGWDGVGASLGAYLGEGNAWHCGSVAARAKAFPVVRPGQGRLQFLENKHPISSVLLWSSSGQTLPGEDGLLHSKPFLAPLGSRGSHPAGGPGQHHAAWRDRQHLERGGSFSRTTKRPGPAASWSTSALSSPVSGRAEPELSHGLSAGTCTALPAQSCPLRCGSRLRPGSRARERGAERCCTSCLGAAFQSPLPRQHLQVSAAGCDWGHWEAVGEGEKSPCSYSRLS